MTEIQPVTIEFALALLDQEGIGRVTALRILERFPTYESLLDYPREQVLLRLKGAPNAERTVHRLFDQHAFRSDIQKVRAKVNSLNEKHIGVIAAGHANWPPGVSDLDRAHRPVVLYFFGSTEALGLTSVAAHARPPIPGDAFESAQSLVRKLITEKIPVTSGAHSGFDVVMHKLCSAAAAPCVMVASCGLARVDSRARPSVAAAVKAGGVLVSPFPPSHGPFDHDDAERVLLQTAIAGPNVFVTPREHTPEAHALEWALDAKRPVFGIPDDEASDALSFSERVHTLAKPVDLDWVIAAARTMASA